MNAALRNLKDLGLNDKEATIYLALYRLGTATAYQVAKESGLKRPTVYLVIDELRKKGLALVTPHKKNQVYTAKNPNDFVNEVHERISSSSRKLLSSLPVAVNTTSSTKVFQGEGALAQGLAYGLRSAKSKDMVAFYAGVYPRTKISVEYTDHLDELGREKFTLRSLVPADSRDEHFRATDKSHRFASKKIEKGLFSPEISIEVFDRYTKFILHKNREVVVIEDIGTANFLKQLFELVWLSR